MAGSCGCVSVSAETVSGLKAILGGLSLGRGIRFPRCMLKAARPYLASIAVTSTSIAMLGHANWLTTRNVEAGIGAFPKASPRHFKAS